MYIPIYDQLKNLKLGISFVKALCLFIVTHCNSRLNQATIFNKVLLGVATILLKVEKYNFFSQKLYTSNHMQDQNHHLTMHFPSDPQTDSYPSTLARP